MYYTIRINDYTGEKCREVDLLQAYETAEAARNAGWTITRALAKLHGLGYENQGDCFMAYYLDGGQTGEGAYTVEILDEYENIIETY